jgi:hypothetical protein
MNGQNLLWTETERKIDFETNVATEFNPLTRKQDRFARTRSKDLLSRKL